MKEAHAWLIFVAVLHSLHACRLSARIVSHRSLLAQLVLTKVQFFLAGKVRKLGVEHWN